MTLTQRQQEQRQQQTVGRRREGMQPFQSKRSHLEPHSRSSSSMASSRLPLLSARFLPLYPLPPSSVYQDQAAPITAAAIVVTSSSSSYTAKDQQQQKEP